MSFAFSNFNLKVLLFIEAKNDLRAFYERYYFEVAQGWLFNQKETRFS